MESFTKYLLLTVSTVYSSHEHFKTTKLEIIQHDKRQTDTENILLNSAQVLFGIILSHPELSCQLCI